MQILVYFCSKCEKNFFSSKWLKKLRFDLKRKNNFDIPNIPNHQRLWGQEFVIAFFVGYKNEVIFCQTNIYDSKAKVRNELSPANTMNSILFAILAILPFFLRPFVVKYQLHFSWILIFELWFLIGRVQSRVCLLFLIWFVLILL